MIETRGRYEEENQKSGFIQLLFFILIALVVLFVVGTIIGLVSKKDDLGHQYRKADPTPEKVVNRSGKSSSRVTTSDLGQFRISTKSTDDEKSVLLVLSPWISYPENDVQLFEEISTKNRKLKSIVNEYFSARSKKEIHSLGEKKIKEELKSKIDEELIMGDISAIYFEQYLFFE